ncbi:hypothetical protein BVY03_01560 [bacterium K02(2017)]|nr:hypothetical protein BVY03_01560 [bacterium K02(2017)]
MLNFQTVEISQIEKPLFSHRFNRDDRPLKTSIQNFGLKTPPSLLFDKGKYHIIDGWARIDILNKMGKSQLGCIVYDASEMNHENAFHLCIELNSWNRKFNVVEKALSLKTALEIFGGLKVPKWFWQLVGIKENIKTIYQYKELLKLPPDVQKYAVNNNITLSVILGFLKFPKTQIETLAHQLFVLPLNQNKLAEILALVLDISKRDEILPVKVMECAFEEVEKRNEFNAVQKEQLLRRILHSKRNPFYETKLKEFDEKIKGLPLNKYTKISPAPYFEDDYVEVNTKINSKKDLDDLVQILQSEVWKELLVEED